MSKRRPKGSPVPAEEWRADKIAALDFAYIRRLAASVLVKVAREAALVSRTQLDAYRLVLLGFEKHLPGIDNARRDRTELEEMRAEVAKLEKLVAELDRGAGGAYLGAEEAPSTRTVAH